MKKTKKKKMWPEKAWRWFREKCRDSRCQAGVPKGSPTKISWRDRR